MRKIAGRPGYELKLSPSNPKVHRWMKIKPGTTVGDMVRGGAGGLAFFQAEKSLGLDNIQVEVIPREDWDRHVGGVVPVKRSNWSPKIRVRDDVLGWIHGMKRGVERETYRLPRDEDDGTSLLRLILREEWRRDARTLLTEKQKRQAVDVLSRLRGYLRSKGVPLPPSLWKPFSDPNEAFTALAEAFAFDTPVFGELVRAIDKRPTDRHAYGLLKGTVEVLVPSFSRQVVIHGMHRSAYSKWPLSGVDRLNHEWVRPRVPPRSEWGKRKVISNFRADPGRVGELGEPIDVLSDPPRDYYANLGVPVFEDAISRRPDVSRFFDILEKRNPAAFQLLASTPVVQINPHGLHVRVLSWKNSLSTPGDSLLEGWGGVMVPFVDRPGGVVVIKGGVHGDESLGRVLIHELAHAWDARHGGGFLTRKLSKKKMADLQERMARLARELKGKVPSRVYEDLLYSASSPVEVPTTLTTIAMDPGGKEVFDRDPALRAFLKEFWGFDFVKEVHGA